MRRTILSSMFALALAAAPATAQVRVGVHIDLPVGRGPVYRPPPPPLPREVRVYDYSARNYGQWRSDARRWQVVTLYFLDGRYYQEPVRWAQPVRMFEYRGQYFSEPRDRDWYSYQQRYLHQFDRRDDRDFRDQRDDRDNGRGNGRGYDPRDDRDNGPVGRGGAGPGRGNGPEMRARPPQGGRGK